MAVKFWDKKQKALSKASVVPGNVETWWSNMADPWGISSH